MCHVLVVCPAYRHSHFAHRHDRGLRALSRVWVIGRDSNVEPLSEVPERPWACGDPDRRAGISLHWRIAATRSPARLHQYGRSRQNPVPLLRDPVSLRSPLGDIRSGPAGQPTRRSLDDAVSPVGHAAAQSSISQIRRDLDEHLDNREATESQIQPAAVAYIMGAKVGVGLGQSELAKPNQMATTRKFDCRWLRASDLNLHRHRTRPAADKAAHRASRRHDADRQQTRQGHHRDGAVSQGADGARFHRQAGHGGAGGRPTQKRWHRQLSRDRLSPTPTSCGGPHQQPRGAPPTVVLDLGERSWMADLSIRERPPARRAVRYFSPASFPQIFPRGLL